ncbi:hypothetical protein AA310_08135 [Arthrobacter sp. YC-RL1]|nr:hypothetical protein ATC04_09880 [Arthrobacter sp. YC-RL1]KLI87885.1 hypothetical protein AA310_08135 [Arthrobacter sp. YC-RL1]
MCITGDALDVEPPHKAPDPISARLFEDETYRQRLAGNRPQLLIDLEHLSTGDQLLVMRDSHLEQIMVDGCEVPIYIVEDDFRSDHSNASVPTTTR